MLTLRSFLGGEWRAGSGEPQMLVNPATEEPLARAGSDGVDLAAALDHARQEGGPALRRLSFAERGALLKAMAEALQKTRDELLQLAIANGGNTRSDAKFDVLVDPKDRTRLMLYEVYEDEAAFQAHQQTPHFKRYVADGIPLLQSRDRFFFRRVSP